MKTLVLALVSLVASSAMAFETCEPYSVEQSEGTFVTVYPCGTNYTIRHRSCIKGKTEIFWENVDSSAETMRPVARTCRNGRFVPAAKPVVHRGCIEGKVEIFHEVVDASADHTQPVHYVCRNGRFKKLY